MSDLRYVLRSLLRSPWFAAAAVVTFALGIGVNIAVFSVVDRLVFRKLPFRSPDELVLLRECTASGCNGAFPAAVAFDAPRRLQSLTDVAVAGMPARYSTSQVADDTPPLTLTGVSSNLLHVLGVQPVIGRDFSDEDLQTRRPVAMLSFETWQRRFRGSNEVLGTALWTRGGFATVVGVLPADFIPPTWTAPEPRWDGLVLDLTGWASIQSNGSIAAPIARLRNGFTPAMAAAEIQGLALSVLPKTTAAADAHSTFRVDPLQTALFSRFRPYVWLILTGCGLLLLLAATNLMTLLIARGQSREREVAIAAAVGAAPGRLVAAAFAESLVLCFAGAAAALAVVAISYRWLLWFLPPLFSRYATGALDVRVVVLTVAVACIAAAGAAAAPALRATRVDLLSVLQRTGTSQRGRLRGGGALLAMEAAMGVVLVAGALLALRSFVRLQNEGLGFVPDDLYLISVTPPVRVTPDASLHNYEQVLDEIRRMPDVRAAAGADCPVGAAYRPMRPLSKTLRNGERYEVSAAYFETVGARLRAGRAFTEPEVRARAPIAILNESGVKLLWPESSVSDAIGRALTLDGETRAVVGVVGDLKSRYGAPSRPALFVPLGTAPMAYSDVVVRMAAGRVPQLAGVRQRIEGRVGLSNVSVRSVSAGLDVWLEDPRFRAALFAVLASIATPLAALGLYAVALFEVRHREHELAVRMSLGASAAGIQRFVIVQTCRPVIVGITAGLLAAWWLERFVSEFLYQVTPHDPATHAIVALILLAASTFAAWVPARRAARIEPARVLRAS